MVEEGESGHRGREERRGRRLSVDLPASLDRRQPRTVRVLDLSLTGCLIRSDAALDRGAVVDLRIELPEGAITAKARVAETSIDGDSLRSPAPHHLAGLEFLGLPAADEMRVRSFLDSEGRRRASARSAPP